MRGGWIFFFKISKRDFTFIRDEKDENNNTVSIVIAVFCYQI